MRVLPIGPFNPREALSYLTERLSANRGQRLGAIDLVNDMGVEPAALAQASAVIASSAMSCHELPGLFRALARAAGRFSGRAAAGQRGHVAGLARDAPTSSPPADRSSRMLALAALLDGHGIPATVLTAPAAVGYLTGGRRAADHADHGQARTPSRRAALAALERVGLLTVEPATAPPTVRISPVLQAALRAAIPEGVLDRRPASPRTRCCRPGLHRSRPAGLRPVCGPAPRPFGRRREAGCGPTAAIRCCYGPATAWTTPA